MKKLGYVFVLMLTVSACGAPASVVTRGEQYVRMYEEKPLSLLVMPPINNSANVDAKELLYTSISRPLAEAGYYVISPRLSMDLLRQESAYDAELFIDRPLRMFRDFFGADAVVFSVIESWAKVGTGIRTEIRYLIKSTLTDQVLFDRKCDLFLDLSVYSGNGGLMGALVGLAATALSTALTDHIVAARKANYYIFRDIPAGRYSERYLKDQNLVAEPKDVTRTVK